MKVIEIIVSPAGETRIETRGYAGADCQDATRSLERALGDRQSERLTPEYHQTHSTDVTRERQLGG